MKFHSPSELPSRKEDAICQKLVRIFTGAKTVAGKDVLSAVENRMDAQNTLTPTAEPAGKPKRSWKTEADDRRTAYRQLPDDGERAFSWYLAKIEVKPSTRARYVFVIEHHILPKLGSVFVAALTAIQLSDFLTQKQKHGRLHGGGLSAKSVRDIGVLIKAALRAAVAEYHFPCDALNAKLPKAKQRKIEPFSTSELDRIGKA